MTLTLEELQFKIKGLEPLAVNLPQGFVQWASDGGTNLEEEFDNGQSFKTILGGSIRMHAVVARIGGKNFPVVVDVPDTANFHGDELNHEDLPDAIGDEIAYRIQVRSAELHADATARFGNTAKQDAVKHAAWSAWLASQFGYDITNIVTQAHEQEGKEDGYPAYTTTMDIYNNKIGIPAGLPFHGEGQTAPTWHVWFDVFAAQYDNGELMTWWPPTADQGLTSDGMLRFSNGQKISN